MGSKASTRPIDLDLVRGYIADKIGPEFHEKKLKKLKGLTLETILRRKNPYLYRAKGAITANDLVEAVLDATISSGEETVFGNFLERLAIFICSKTFGGKKSSTKGLDLEFSRNNKHYIVTIKSGPSWGNSGQIEKMQENFKRVKRTLRTSGGMRDTEIMAVEACCYGADDKPDKGDYQKLCGQRFWSFISGREDLYRELVEPLGETAQEQTKDLLELRARKLNLFTAAFLKDYCRNGAIDWDKLVRYNSGINK